MLRRPPRSTRTDTLFPYTTLFRSKAKGLDTTVMTALDSIAWTFNIRGQDVSHTPVGLAFALLHADATADLFIAPEKITDAVQIGRASCRDRVCQYVSITVVADTLKKKR